MRSRIKSRWHQLVEAVLPWYDPEKERAVQQRSERITRDAIAARISAEKVRQDYAAMGKRLER